MSDVVVTVVESNTNVTVSEQDVAVAVTENTVQVSASTAGIQGNPGANNDPTYVTVRNRTGATLAKGTIVYISGANGNNVLVTPAIATGDSTSARTLGWLAASIANNASGLCMVEGYLEGINTQGITAGAQLYLSGTTAGAFTATEPVAPVHLVYVGIATKISAGDGHVFVKVQNGYELDELHNVLITSPSNNQVLAYDSSTQLWKNATNAPDGVTSITATAPLTGGTITSTGSIGLDQTALSITKSQVSDFTSGTVTSASTAQQSGTAVYSVNSGTAVYATTSGTAVFATNASTAVNLSGSITKSQVSDFTSGTVASASTAQQAGTAVFADTSGTATYSTTSGTALTISGSITKSQVSDFTSGTVTSASTAQQSGTAVYALTAGTATFATTSGTATYATTSGTAVSISGSITQSQVTSLVTDLAGKASLGTANTFTVGGHVITNAATAVIPLTITGVASQSASLLSLQNSSLVSLFSVSAAGLITAKVVGNAANQNRGLLLSNTSDTWQSGLYLKSDASGNPRLTLLAPTGALGEAVSIDAAAKVGIGSTAPTAQLDVYSGAAARVGAVIRGAASQSADLTQWQNSGGTAIASIGSSGILKADQLRTLNNFVHITESNSGGSIRILKATAAAAPLANEVRLQVLAGTNVNTLKLVAVGPNGTAITILDNLA